MAKPNDMSNSSGHSRLIQILRLVFVKGGILPWFLLGAILIFTGASDSFLTNYNIMLIGRQSTYLVLVALGQMVALLTTGLDLSVGSIFAMTSVITATVMVAYLKIDPDAIWTTIFLGSLAGLAVGIIIGMINGVGIAFFHVPPFIMTLAMSTIVFGLALQISL